MVNEDNPNIEAHDTLVTFWWCILIVTFGLLLYVIYRGWKAGKREHKKLYNFKKAPKAYINDDSFIMDREE